MQRFPPAQERLVEGRAASIRSSRGVVLAISLCGWGLILSTLTFAIIMLLLFDANPKTMDGVETKAEASIIQPALDT
jgi:hypothetical protein